MYLTLQVRLADKVGLDWSEWVQRRSASLENEGQDETYVRLRRFDGLAHVSVSDRITRGSGRGAVR